MLLHYSTIENLAYTPLWYTRNAWPSEMLPEDFNDLSDFLEIFRHREETFGGGDGGFVFQYADERTSGGGGAGGGHYGVVAAATDLAEFDPQGGPFAFDVLCGDGVS